MRTLSFGWRLFSAVTVVMLVTLVIGLNSTGHNALAASGVEVDKKVGDSLQASSPLRPLVGYSSRNDVSPLLRGVKPLAVKAGKEIREIPLQPLPKREKAKSGQPLGGDPLRQSQHRPYPQANMPAPIANFEGLNNVDGVLPPDTEGDIGYDPSTGHKYYVQWVNVSFKIWDVTNPAAPVPLYGPAPGNTLWSGFGGPCETTNDGDPIVLFDHLANRWFMSQFALPNFPGGPFYQCIAVSQTPDPTGAWYRYEFLVSNTKMNDYAKFGVWPDAYYMTVNQFAANSGTWAGQGVVAFERAKMLQGMPARMVYFDLFSINPDFGGMLPSDLDGPPPPTGTPNYFVEMDDNAWGWPTDRLSIWEFHVDWTNPLLSTFGAGGTGNPNVVLNTAPFDSNLCNYVRQCIPQPGGTAVDAISDRLMYRLQYRNFGTYQTLVVNHTVDANGADLAGIRWYELRNSGAGWTINQQGTYAPDSAHRWMGSIAMDASGNIALGYSVSSSTVYPSIRYVGRLAGDPAGTLPQGETVLIAGGGYQTHLSGRWGDYSTMSVDPADDCTFWYTQEYYATTGLAAWQTRIGSFKFPSCTTPQQGVLQGTVTNTSGNPIANAKVDAGTFSAFTDSNGFYQFASLPPGTYSVTASAYGYASSTASGVSVTAGGTTVQDFSLPPLPTVIVQGTVTDGSGHAGMPLYARIDIAGYPGSPIFTDPVTGQYSVTLVQGTSYTFNVSAVSGGYNTASRVVTPPAGGSTENFALTIAAACNAPGYTFVSGFSEDFDAGTFPPTGWTVVDNAGSGVVWKLTSAWGDGNYTGGAGDAADVDSDNAGTVEFDTELRTPTINPTSLPGLMLIYKANYRNFWGLDFLDLDISTNGGSTWTNVLHWNENHGAFRSTPGELVTADLTSYATAPFLLRWHYYDPNTNDWDWYAQIDEVRIGVCQAVAGGLVVGNVYDANGNPLNGASVISVDAPTETATTFSTPDDPNVNDGFYILFSSLTGAHPFKAVQFGYGNDTQTPTVVANGTVRQDFYIGGKRKIFLPLILR